MAGQGERTAALLLWSWQTNALSLSLLVGASSFAGGAVVAAASWIRGQTFLKSMTRAFTRGAGGTLVFLALLAALQSVQVTAVQVHLSHPLTGYLPLAALLVASGGVAVVCVLRTLRTDGAS
jgi:F0F1-type ATP synthase assembly protein I